MRLDNYLVEIKLFDSRTKAKQAIERGEVYINGKLIDKCSFNVDSDNEKDVEIRCLKSFVSLGGYKLDKALTDFNLSVKDLIVADIGASTGGFTDCLLQSGAKKVYAVDLNDKLLHVTLLDNKKVHPIIKNAKELVCEDFDDELDLIVADLSFISVTHVIDVFGKLLKKGKKLIILIKPQFETGKKMRFKNGIIRDKKIHQEVCDKVIYFGENSGFANVQLTTAPINDEKNTEFLILFTKNQ